MAEMLVRHEPASASAARREIALDLESRGVSQDTIEDTTLVLSELLGNAIRHCDITADDQLDVTWAVQPDAVVVSVADPSRSVPARRHAAPDAPSGRGLAIIEAVATAWGVQRTRRGKRVWARIALT
jgi:serine/threonine-protein kinase RsbW